MITKVHLRNFLAFQELVLPANRLNVFTGTNSAGKSTVLHSLALLRQSASAGLLPEALLLNGEFVQLGSGRDVLHADPVASAGSDSVSISIGVDEGGRENHWEAQYVAEADVLSSTSVREASSDFLSGSFQYLTSDRLPPSLTYPKSHEFAAVKQSLGARGEHTINFLRVNASEPIENSQCLIESAQTSGYLDQANAWLAKISEGTSFGVYDVPGTDFVSIGFERQGPDVRTPRQRSTNVGFGLSFALPIVVACLASSETSTLLVENPEAHLHPSAQALLGDLLVRASNGGAQVFMETHSDHVLNAVRLAVKKNRISASEVLLHFFSREVGVLQPNVTTLSVEPDGAIANWPSGFFDQWDRALMELLDD